MNFENMTLREIVLCQRSKLGLTQVEASLRAGVAQSTVENIEAGKCVRYPTALKVLHALGLNVEVTECSR